MDKAAAIENDETMIINSDHSIITTPVESPQTDVAGTSNDSPVKKPYQQEDESDGTLTATDTSSSDAVAAKNKRHRPKARSESNRSEKYAKSYIFRFFIVQLVVSIPHETFVHL